MKALVLFPSFVSSGWGADWVKNPSTSAPLGPLYVATALQSAGFEVAFFDLNVQRFELDEFAQALAGVRVAGVSVYSQNRTYAEQLIRDIRAVDPEIKIVCGGPHPSFTGEHVPGADLTVAGEVEGFIGDLVTSLMKGDDVHRFPGVISAGEQVATGASGQTLVDDLDASPFPDRRLFDQSAYDSWAGFRLGRRVDYIVASRGCPYACTFCTDPFNRYRTRSPDNVISELRMLRDNGAEIVVFVDDLFLAHRNKGLELLHRIADADLSLPLVIETRVDRIDEESVEACRRAGVRMIQLGIESGNQQVLDFYGKRQEVSAVEPAVRLIHRHGLYSLGFFIIGAPFEREAHIRDTIDLIRSAPLDFVAISRLAYRFPSPLWQDLVDRQIITDDVMEKLADERTGSYPEDELARVMKRVYLSFYLRPRYLGRLITKILSSGDHYLLRWMVSFLFVLITETRVFSYGVAPDAGRAS